ncbi:MAG TPA: class I SAM-dependent methyltransferase [Nitrospira sp.]|nr:class I SAM-dependent methyltransferase [Nitrospira sp.]
MGTVNWNANSKLGFLRSVIDPTDELGFKNELIDRIQWTALKRHLVDSKHMLDYGCGSGRLAPRAKSMEIKYSGIDTSMGMVETAREIHKDSSLDFRHFDGSTIPYADSTFDTIVSIGVFIYILKTANEAAVFSEIKRVLKPDGHLVIVEQASLSGQKSAAAINVLTEQDYVAIIAKDFDIENRYRVRTPEFSERATKWTTNKKVPRFLFNLMVGGLAEQEFKTATSAPDSYFKTRLYYDFLINAKLRKK